MHSLLVMRYNPEMLNYVEIVHFYTILIFYKKNKIKLDLQKKLTNFQNPFQMITTFN